MQVSQFTSPMFINAVESVGVDVSMDGRRRFLDRLGSCNPGCVSFHFCNFEWFVIDARAFSGRHGFMPRQMRCEYAGAIYHASVSSHFCNFEWLAVDASAFSGRHGFMPRQMRCEYAGAIYHVMNRGDRREAIFRNEADRRMFLSTLTEACGKTEWQIHAYCLMRNHFHLVIETPQPNLVFGMKWLLGVYTKRFNIGHKECGHLFAGRYKALHVEGGGGYLQTVCDYVHLNPARAGVLKGGQPLEDFPWSSYGEYLKPARHRPVWLRVDRLLGEKSIPRDSTAGRRQFARLTEERRREDLTKEFKPVERG